MCYVPQRYCACSKDQRCNNISNDSHDIVSSIRYFWMKSLVVALRNRAEISIIGHWSFSSPSASRSSANLLSVKYNYRWRSNDHEGLHRSLSNQPKIQLSRKEMNYASRGYFFSYLGGFSRPDATFLHRDNVNRWFRCITRTLLANGESIHRRVPRINRVQTKGMYIRARVSRARNVELLAFQGRDVYDFMGQLRWYTAS